MKKRVKISILLLIVAIIIGIMPNVAKATDEITEETLQKMIKVLPDEMNVDLKESEYEKASDVVEQNVRKIWNENGINVQKLEEQGYDFGFETGYLYFTQEKFYQANVYIEYINEDGSISSTGKEKTINIIYSNHNNYNKSDEQLIKKLELPALPKYITYDFNTKGIFDEVMKNITEYYEKAIGDKNIKIVPAYGAYGDYLLEWGFHGLNVAIFKNDILYDIRSVENTSTICQMIIPANVGNTEKDYINYATPLIKNYWKELCEAYEDDDYQYSDNIVLIKENNGIENYYKIKCNETEIGSIILKKDAIQNIVKEDKDTGIKIETTSDVLSSNVKLSSIKVTEQSILDVVKTSLKDVSDKYIVYDITLLENNVKVQPSGKLKISIPIPKGYNKEKLVVYRVADNGEKTKYDVKVEGNYATFETDHFSTYVLGELKQETNNSNKGELDETPKTGTIDLTYYIIPVAIISAVGIAVTIKRKQSKH